MNRIEKIKGMIEGFNKGQIKSPAHSEGYHASLKENGLDFLAKLIDKLYNKPPPDQSRLLTEEELVKKVEVVLRNLTVSAVYHTFEERASAIVTAIKDELAKDDARIEALIEEIWTACPLTYAKLQAIRATHCKANPFFSVIFTDTQSLTVGIFLVNRSRFVLNMTGSQAYAGFTLGLNEQNGFTHTAVLITWESLRR